MRRAFITGTAGFIGFHLAKNLLEHGWRIHGFDAFTDYYDVSLKRNRNKILLQEKSYSYTEARLEDAEKLIKEVQAFEPEVIIHLAAQAGVRYSLEYPRTYIESNIVGTFNVMEAARLVKPRHLMMASTSSVYGANTIMPFQETEKADTQLTIYAATKKANEVMAHSYAHLWDIPTTMFRFFTVYGSMGRPDLALFKFVDAIIDRKSIEIYNNGEMYRDFTYVNDLVKGIRLLIDAAPADVSNRTVTYSNDSLSPVAPFRIVNIGNSDKVRLLDFVDAIEAELGIKAIRKYLPMQTGDVPATWADTSLLKQLTGYQPETNYKHGIAEFVRWFRDYYNK